MNTDELKRLAEAEAPLGLKLHAILELIAEREARLMAEVAELKSKLTEKASLLRGCYAADNKQKQRIAQRENAIGNLQKVKGRYHTEQAYNALIAALKEDKTC